MVIKLKNLGTALLEQRNLDSGIPRKIVKFVSNLPDAHVAIVDDHVNQRLTLIVENWEGLGRVQFDKLVDFCSDFTKLGPTCRYDVCFGSNTIPCVIITWCDPRSEDDFLVMMANSNGFIGNGYDDIKLFGGRVLAAYRSEAAREMFATCAVTR